MPDRADSESPVVTREDFEALRKARAVARSLSVRRVPMGRIEQQLFDQGFDRRVVQVTMRHMCAEWLEGLERSERLFRLAGAALIAAAVLIVAATFVVDRVTGLGTRVYWFMLAFGVLMVMRGYWLRARIRATRSHPWVAGASAPDHGDPAA